MGIINYLRKPNRNQLRDEIFLHLEEQRRARELLKIAAQSLVKAEKSIKVLFDAKIGFDFEALSALPLLSDFEYTDGVVGHRIPTADPTRLLFFASFKKDGVIPVHFHNDAKEEIHVYKGLIKNTLTNEVTAKVLKIQPGTLHQISAKAGTEFYVLFARTEK